MIKETFFNYFQDYSDCYVIIGGNAASILMGEEGLDFRSTQDYDMVVIFEKTTDAFAATFMQFIKDYGYLIREYGTDESKKKNYYRFQHDKTNNADVPKMIELFSRKPLGYDLRELESETTPLHYEEGPSLSAIVLNDDYYQVLKNGVIMEGDMPLLNTPYLILFKAKAHLDILQRIREGKRIGHHADKVKHFKDVCRLTLILSAENYDVTKVPTSVLGELREFIQVVESTEVSKIAAIDSDLRKEDVIEALKELLP